jgi:hypothetical protein
MTFPIILSFDVGVINLAYCLLTKKEFTKLDENKVIPPMELNMLIGLY